MHASKPFSLRIFVADGDPDGLRVVERSNWVGKALIFPRALLPRVKQREELAYTGVYLLLGPREDGDGEMLYIGEGDPVRPRLEDHYAKKDFWNRAVCFVAPGQLNKAHVQFLESNLVRLAKAAKRVPLDNANNPAEPSLSEPDRADMLVFLENMLGMLPVLGVHAFEQAVAVPVAGHTMLTCRSKGITATGYESTQGFVVKAGSQAVATVTPSMQEHMSRLLDERQVLIENGVLQKNGEHYVVTQDYVFSSPSTAASVLLGCSSNGRVAWKDAQGTTLKALQEAEAAH
ncbi:GIY-YIG nuclease family protein [Uliginosibacterium sediminicola]|uniref:GIY-YIG nuclease family protein n=1 Tax=Uliginosibacterium sediminicola TaxID=2024550 RepID=A0ABU9YY68_9RHOO